MLKRGESDMYLTVTVVTYSVTVTHACMPTVTTYLQRRRGRGVGGVGAGRATVFGTFFKI